MEQLPKGTFLKFKPNQLQEIRKLYDLDKPGRIDEAVDLLVDWIKKQDHFRIKEFPREYLERLIIASKGSVERAKARFDKICTFRTLWPEFFTVSDIHTFANYWCIFNSVFLPELTDDLYRVNLFKLSPKVPLNSNLILEYIRYSIIMCEYLRKQDYPSGFLIILDYRDVNFMDLLKMASPTQISQMMNLYTEGYGMRIKGIHIMTTSKMSDAFVAVLKQVLSKKVGGRIHVHMDIESLHEFVPKKILPSEYGGSAVSIEELRDSFLEELSTEEHIEYMKFSQSASTDESKRTKDKFNENYIGMPGSFRTLSVD
ncbi:alpha-tocopherol transfer protein-like isoform X1 [Choristoneura fumiferana]|uniref:alpha-tocopherol transfer protein-like isoform X1 n=1 Tax=Choristoneura fumiferana TaxID=7141 RepID=UPI003D156E29